MNFTFFGTVECKNYECFKSSMEKCDKAIYVNDAPEASWKYTILGEEDGKCKVEVKLIQAKQGDLGLDSLMGYAMDCEFAVGLADYPEKNLDVCHGRLKEELQGVMIKKLYGYILQNVGKINKSLSEFS